MEDRIEALAAEAEAAKRRAEQAVAEGLLAEARWGGQLARLSETLRGELAAVREELHAARTREVRLTAAVALLLCGVAVAALLWLLRGRPAALLNSMWEAHRVIASAELAGSADKAAVSGGGREARGGLSASQEVRGKGMECSGDNGGMANSGNSKRSISYTAGDASSRAAAAPMGALSGDKGTRLALSKPRATPPAGKTTLVPAVVPGVQRSSLGGAVGIVPKEAAAGAKRSVPPRRLVLPSAQSSRGRGVAVPSSWLWRLVRLVATALCTGAALCIVRLLSWSLGGKMPLWVQSAVTAVEAIVVGALQGH